MTPFVLTVLLSILPFVSSKPFLTQVDSTTWTFGNSIWNATQKGKQAKQLWYNDRELVGKAAGHYYGSNNEGTKFNILGASITAESEYGGTAFIDFSFDTEAGEQHWVIFEDSPGAYQYFINKDLPVIGEFRSLWRLDNKTFTHGKTSVRDETLPPLAWHTKESLVFDSTYERPDGSYITKYDFADFIQNFDYYGVYGEDVGSWYIVPGKDYYNGDHLRQELTVHREANTGDVVQLNMIHGNHFYRSINDTIVPDKIFGPWLWYLNNGSQSDVAERAEREFSAWPYTWLSNEAYQSRGSVKGILKLSDGRFASKAAIFLGDNRSKVETLRQGTNYYYAAYADDNGAFQIDNVRTGTYGLYAWSNGSSIADISSTFQSNDVKIEKSNVKNLETLEWDVTTRRQIFRVGEFDRTAYGFKVGGEPRAYGLTQKCPADLTYKIGESSTSDWCFAQTKVGNWTISFPIEEAPSGRDAKLVVSVAGYAAYASSNIWVNGERVGNITSGVGIQNDGSVYRSCTVAGDWRNLEFMFDTTILQHGDNEVVFELYENTGNDSELPTPQRGVMFDAIALEV